MKLVNEKIWITWLANSSLRDRIWESFVTLSSSHWDNLNKSFWSLVFERKKEKNERKREKKELLELHVLNFFRDFLCVGLEFLDRVSNAVAQLFLFQKFSRNFRHLKFDFEQQKCWNKIKTHTTYRSLDNYWAKSTWIKSHFYTVL